MTYASLLADVAALNVVGVRKRFTAPPEQLSTAMIPAQYPRLPNGNGEVATLGGEIGLFNGVCELVIVMSPVGQNNNNANFDATVAMMDALQAAIATNAVDINIDRWTITQQVDVIGTTIYWMLVARIEASE